MKKLFVVVAVIFAAVLLLAFSASAGPLVSFEDLATGTLIQGAGDAHPSLVITPIPSGDATVIETGSATSGTYGAPNGPNTKTNNCLEDADGVRLNVNVTPHKKAKGFANIAARNAGGKQEFDFSFVGAKTVSQFSIRVFDWGDYNPACGTAMAIQLTAKDMAGNVLDQKTASMTNVEEAINPRSATFNSITIDPYIAGDACTASLGEPGYIELSVADPIGISKVELRMLGAYDPNIAFDSINFTACTRTIGFWKNHTWSGINLIINSDMITEEEGGSTPVDAKPGTGYLWQARGNNFSMLYAQLIAAKLNCHGEGDCSPNGIITQAEQFLQSQSITEGNFDADFTSKSQKSTAAELASKLDAFNNRFHCQGE